MISFDNCVDLHRFPRGLDPLRIMAKGGVASTSGSLQQSGHINTRVKRLKLERPVMSYLNRNSRLISIF